MDKFKQWLYKTFNGIYGLDRLYFVLFGASVFFIILNLIIGHWIMMIPLALTIGFMYFRVFSRNIAARKRESDWFFGIVRKVTSWFKLQKNRFKDRKTHVYKKCPKCKAVLRLPKRKGTNTVACPRCKHKFEVKG
jgi:DNA-directed RNA polymerase subunit RPC12/RpoP